MTRTLLATALALGACGAVHAAGFRLESPDVKPNAMMDKRFEAAALAGFMINANSLAKAGFTAKYGRPKAKK